MKTNVLFFLFVLFIIPVSAQLKVEDFRTESNKSNDTRVIQDALDALNKQGQGCLDFDGSRIYEVKNSLELPRYVGQIRKNFILNGNGATLQALADSVNIFNRIPQNQNEALNKMMSCRFVIRDLTFVGGAKGINLGATYGSSIERCNFHNQRLAAVDIQFGLQTVISHCYATNCLTDNFILRTGEDWGGGSNNSQSNHSVIESSRVYARDGAKTGFKILASGGVVLRDIISEGSRQIDYAVYADRLKSTTVRFFKIENFHLEHAPIKAGVFLNMTGNSEINGLFYQLARKGEEFTLIHNAGSIGEIHLFNIPHFVGGTVLRQDAGGAGWVIKYSKKQFLFKDNWRIREKDGSYGSRLPVILNIPAK